ncbi:MAG: hypothetical protein AB1847_19690 [bacterium]
MKKVIFSLLAILLLCRSVFLCSPVSAQRAYFKFSTPLGNEYYGYELQFPDNTLSSIGYRKISFDIGLSYDDANNVVSTPGTLSAKTLRLQPSATQNIFTASSTILANASVVSLDPNADHVLTSTPTIADGSAGALLYLTCANNETHKVTLQDQDTLAGSNLQLSASTRDITGKAPLLLLFDGTDWVELTQGSSSSSLYKIMTDPGDNYYITPANCTDSYIITNNGAGAARTYQIPNADTVGLPVRVMATDAYAINLDPNRVSDQIEGLTNNPGDKISSSGTAGDWIQLICVEMGKWREMGRSGSWTDAN